jgi:hypothetical protein
MAIYRTQLFSPDDLDNVKKVQAGYKATRAKGARSRSGAAA